MSTQPSGLMGLFAPPVNTSTFVIPPPVVPQVTVTALPQADLELINSPWDPFNKAQHEAKMNQWLMAQTEMANARKISIYMQAYTDWRTNALIYQSCRPPITPPAQPVCQPLEDVKPMAAGYWFGTHA